MEQIIPHWHTDINSIMLPPELEHKRPESHSDIILKEINIDLLIRNLTCGNAEPLMRPGLYKPEFSCRKIDLILCHWKSAIKLLPPTIYYKAGQGCILCDGRHRINVALHLGNSFDMPIIVSLSQKSLMERILCK